ncbi:MAG: hypothetical protein KF745_02485 [Phycisphaeraceae bacterium]|nr:hypothetical protein [Phycisphaeraceae bacterium]
MKPLPDPTTSGATQSLHEVVSELNAARPEPEAPTPDALAADTALRLYASGRLALLKDDLPSAVDDLESAARLDPTSPQPVEALAEAQLRSGSMRAAEDSFVRAAELGSVDPLGLLAAARVHHRRSNDEAASAVLARLWASESITTDPALPYIVNALLGQSLLNTGRSNAGAEALRLAVGVPDPFPEPTRYREELSDLYRRRAELWRSIGDAACRVGHYNAAIEAYSAASELPSLDAGSLLPREVYACLRQGQSARAALVILGDIAAQDANVQDRHVELISYLAEIGPEAAPLLGQSIEYLRTSRASPAPSSLDGRLARAAAAAFSRHDPGTARGILIQRLSSAPSDGEAMATLLKTYGARQGDLIARDLASLVGSTPFGADRYALSVLDNLLRDQADQVFGALSTDESWEARLLFAALLSRAGRGDEAIGLVRSLQVRRPHDLPAAALAVSVGTRAGQWDIVEAGLSVLASASASPAASPDIQVAYAKALAACQRFSEALAVVRRVLPDTSDASPSAVDNLIFAADLSGLLAKYDDAESFLLRAVDADPYLEPAYLSLIRLYADSGPLADQMKVAEAVRTVREHIPSSRGLRLLRAQELARAGQFAVAEPELLDLAEEDPSDRETFQTLAAVWDFVSTSGVGRDAILARGRQRLTAIAQRSTGSIWPVVALARLDAAESGPDAGLARLAKAASGATHADAEALSASAEDILRRSDRAKEADVRAVARLAASEPNIPNTIGLAAALLRTGSAQRATEVLRDHLPPSAQLTPDQASAITSSIAAILQSDPEQAIPVVRTLALAASPASAPVLFRAWLEVVAIGGTPSDAVEFVRAAVERDLAPALLGGDRADAADSPPTAADLAYQMGVAMASRRRTGGDEVAVPLYELALEYNPTHPLTCNNLGYTLVEQGRDIDRAERLLEVAHNGLPDDPNVTDSIGWLRYKLGVLDDERDATGEITREGAVSLLRRAVQLGGARNDGTLADHLADALWLRDGPGDREEAIRTWRLAMQAANDWYRAMTNAGIQAAAIKAQDVLRSVQAKLGAASRGSQPKIAPRFPLAQPTTGVQD